MGCTSSTPAAPRTAQPELTKSRIETPPSAATDEQRASSAQPVSATSSATSMPANPAPAAMQKTPSNGSMRNQAIASESAKPQTPANQSVPKTVAFDQSPKGKERKEQRVAPPANEQPPVKRVAIVDTKDQHSNRSVLSAAGDTPEGDEDAEKPRKLEEYYDVDRTRRIGKGHYASVFIGKNRETGERFAVKMIEKRLSKTERLALEVNVMRRAGAHSNIVQLVDVFETDNQLQLVLELVEGGELFEYLVEHGPYSEATAAMHIRDITRAIEFLHSQNIIHRDLKPENILLTSKDESARIKVADFGLAKLMFADVTRTVCGTWAYCAYEVKKPGGAYDSKCDLWSIGVIAYILLSAYHPFDPQGDATDDEIWQRIARADYNFEDPAWVNVSDTAKDFVSKLLVLDPKQRLSAEEALQHPWLKEVAEQAGQDKEHPQPALSPAINDKLATFQVRSKMAMNPLQKAAAAMKSRVGSWKSSSVSSTGAPSPTNSNSNERSPSWGRRSMVIAAAAAAAAARSARRSGGGTPTNAGEDKSPRSWSTGSGRFNNVAPAGPSGNEASTHSSSSSESTPPHTASPMPVSAAEQFPALPEEGRASPSAPYVSSPLKTAPVLMALPSEETLLVPSTPGAFPIEEHELIELSPKVRSEEEEHATAEDVGARDDGEDDGTISDADTADNQDEDLNETFVSARSDNGSKIQSIEGSFASARSAVDDLAATSFKSRNSATAPQGKMEIHTDEEEKSDLPQSNDV